MGTTYLTSSQIINSDYYKSIQMMNEKNSNKSYGTLIVKEAYICNKMNFAELL